MSSKISRVKKIIFTHLFLNLYLLAIVQPAIPILEYLLNYNYIAAELCENKDKPILTCNGKCYLEKQIVKQQDLDRDASAPVPPRVDFEKFLIIKTIDFTYQLHDVKQLHQTTTYYNLLKEISFSESLFRPPAA